MTDNELIDQGNDLRSKHKPVDALACYAQAFIINPDNASAWNNYGNVMRECGQPHRSVPFLQHAIAIDPNSATANFNLAVAYLAMGDYQRGWVQYEHRWNFEHLAGTLPKFDRPRWNGEQIQGKTIFVLGEQGHGDNIQFVRYLYNLHHMGARIIFATTNALVPMFSGSDVINKVVSYDQLPEEFDYWTPLLSIPRILGITLENMPKTISYINCQMDLSQKWLQRLGPKTRMRIGFAWSGRTDNWLNEHKGMPFETMLALIKDHPQYDWINLQIDATAEQEQQLQHAGVKLFPGTVTTFVDTAALINHCDVVLSVDTAVAHLAAAMGRPTWLMLNWFAACWRWLVNRDDSPWYPTMRIFRQTQQDDWQSVNKKVSQYLSWFKV